MTNKMRLTLTGLLVATLAAPLLGSAGCAGVGTPKVIYLARHGQTEWNRVSRLQGDPDLDAVGYLNRASLWMLLRHEPIAEIYTSAARRTQRTAALVAREKGLKINPWPGLNEIQPGVLEGVCFALLSPEAATKPGARRCVVDARGSRPKVVLKELRKITAGAFGKASLTVKVPQGDSYQDLLDRTAPFIEHLGRRRTDSAVLIVGHGVINRILLHRLLGWSIPQVRELRQENDQVYRIEGAGTSAQKISLYTPGVGWKPCSPPKPGDKQLDCAPAPTVTRAHELLGQPSPEPATPAEPTAAPAQPAATPPAATPAPTPADPSQPTP